MKIIADDENNVILKLSLDELSFIRYGLNAGAEKLESSAAYFKSIGFDSSNMSRFSCDVRGVSDQLEKAVYDWLIEDGVINV